MRKEEQQIFGFWVMWARWIEKKKKRGSLGFNIGQPFWSSWDETLKQIRDGLLLLSPLAQNRSESAQALISNLPLPIFVLLLILSNIFVFPCYSQDHSKWATGLSFWEYDPHKVKVWEFQNTNETCQLSLLKFTTLELISEINHKDFLPLYGHLPKWWIVNHVGLSNLFFKYLK